jgi:hypothetical protein
MRFAIVLAALLLAAPAGADFKTLDLRSECMNENEMVRLLCKSYLKGIVDVTLMTGILHNSLESPKDRTFSARTVAVCYEKGEEVSMDAVVQLFLNWAIRNPKEWSLPAQFGALHALREAWPCSEGEGFTDQIPSVRAPLPPDKPARRLNNEPKIDDWIPGARK